MELNSGRQRAGSVALAVEGTWATGWLACGNAQEQTGVVGGHEPRPLGLPQQ
jgi:hypothetical protein